MNKILKFHFGTIKIFDDYLIANISEGITITKAINADLEQIALKYFPIKPFVYITHRIHSYAVDPNVYIRTSLIKNLAGFAVVSKNQAALNNADIEKLFLNNKPFETFHNIEDAIKWTKLILNSDYSEEY